MASLSPHDLDFLTELALQQVALVKTLRDALEAGDDQRALEIARQMCGMAPPTAA